MQETAPKVQSLFFGQTSNSAEKTSPKKTGYEKSPLVSRRALLCFKLCGEGDLFQCQNPGRQFFSVGIVHLCVGWHGHGAPHTGTALDDLASQLVNGISLTSILACNFFVGRAYKLLFHCMARHAVFGSCQRLIGKRRVGHWQAERNGKGQNTAGGHQGAFHHDLSRVG